MKFQSGASKLKLFKKISLYSGLITLVLYFGIFQGLSALIGSNSLNLLSPAKAQAEASPYVTANDTNLYLKGEKYQFTGINAYELGTYWGGDGSCGAMLSNAQLTSFFSSLKPYSMVRMWAFQGSMGVDITTHKIDWTYLDRVVNIATQYKIKLTLTLSDQAGTCDDQHWHDIAWYNGGYKTDYPNSQGTTPLSYWNYIKQIVPHYADNPTVAIWELVNEPEASGCANPVNGASCEGTQTCVSEPQAEASLLSFFNTVGSEVKKLDKGHQLVGSGLIGSGQCGSSGSDYQTINASSGIDIASYHDYGSDSVAIPGDQWNGLQVRINQMAAINKPLMVGETGILASSDGTTGCDTLTQRASQFQTKLSAMFSAGIVGFMPWDFTPGSTSGCSYDVNPSDPLISMLNQNGFNYVTPSKTAKVK